MTSPLEGIRILDLTQGQVGPYATTMLAQMGAEVIKIEDYTVGGDVVRGIVGGESMGETKTNYVFEANNRNKKSIAVNLKTGPGKEIIYRLARKTDVFVQNLRQGAVERLEMDYDTLRKLNPRIIYASGSSFGKLGPDRENTGFDIIGQARGGIMSVNGPPDRPPMPVGGGYVPVGDQVTAMLLAYGIMLALFTRERTGIGQEVHVSMLAAMLALQNWRFEGYLATDEVPQRTHGVQSLNPLYGIYQTSEGEWIALSMYQSDPFWSRFCHTLGIQDLENDPRFNSHENRIENREALVPVIQKEFAARTRAELLRILEENKLQFAPVNNYAHLAADPQVIANNYIVDFDHPIAGPMKVLAVPVELSETPGAVGNVAPELGQHSEEVITELAGYTWEEVAQLKESGAIM